MDAAQPTIDSGLQNVQRHCALIEQFRVERPDIEASPQRLLRPCPQTAYLPSAQGARQRLAGQRQVAIHRGARGRLLDRQLGLQVIDRLLASPALRVQAGVDHQSGRAAQSRPSGRRSSILDRGKAPFPRRAKRRTNSSLRRRPGRRRICGTRAGRSAPAGSRAGTGVRAPPAGEKSRRRGPGAPPWRRCSRREWRRSFHWACRADRTMPARSPAGTARRRGSRNRPAALGKTARASAEATCTLSSP